MKTRVENWLREAEKLPAAQAAGAGWLPICSGGDPAAGDVRRELEAKGAVCALREGRLCVRVPGNANEALYQAPAEISAPELDVSKATVRVLADRLIELGFFRRKA